MTRWRNYYRPPGGTDAASLWNVPELKETDGVSLSAGQNAPVLGLPGTWANCDVAIAVPDNSDWLDVTWQLVRKLGAVEQILAETTARVVGYDTVGDEFRFVPFELRGYPGSSFFLRATSPAAAVEGARVSMFGWGTEAGAGATGGGGGGESPSQIVTAEQTAGEALISGPARVRMLTMRHTDVSGSGATYYVWITDATAAPGGATAPAIMPIKLAPGETASLEIPGGWQVNTGLRVDLSTTDVPTFTATGDTDLTVSAFYVP